MAIATGSVFSHTDALVQTWNLGSATDKGALVVQNDVVGVTLTPTTGLSGTDEIEIGPYTVSRPKGAGVGNDKATAIGTYAAGVALDGTWEFSEVTGATVSTAQGTPVFLTSGGDLTLTEGSNARVGTVNYPASYAKAAGTLPIAIGL